MKRAYEGTAIAIAMGGAWLPDNKIYAITANYGTFRGQNAFAASGMVRVADFAYLNGAVGVGFDQAGSAAGQASPLRGRRARRGGPVFRAARIALAFVCLAPIPAAALQKPAAAKPPPPAPAPAPQPAQIDRNGVLILIRSTLAALDQANKTGNYTVLRDLGAPSFQAANNAARLGEIFARQRAQNLDLAGVLVLEPQLTLLPQIEANGTMRLAGFFSVRAAAGEFRARLRSDREPMNALCHFGHSRLVLAGRAGAGAKAAQGRGAKAAAIIAGKADTSPAGKAAAPGRYVGSDHGDSLRMRAANRQTWAKAPWQASPEDGFGHPNSEVEFGARVECPHPGEAEGQSFAVTALISV